MLKTTVFARDKKYNFLRKKRYIDIFMYLNSIKNTYVFYIPPGYRIRKSDLHYLINISQEVKIPKIHKYIKTYKEPDYDLSDVKENQKHYVYRNYNDFCLGRSFPPLIINNNITIGQNYLIHCINLVKNYDISNNFYVKNCLPQLKLLEELLGNTLKEVIVKIDFKIPFTSTQKIESVVLSLLSHIDGWKNKLKGRASLALNLICYFNFRDMENLDRTYHVLSKIFKNIDSSKIGIVWFTFESIEEGYIQAIQECNFIKALKIFYNYYQSCVLFLAIFFGLYDKLHCAVGINPPSWMIPADMPKDIKDFYIPLVIPIASKIMVVPKKFEFSTCLSLSWGAGCIAKAMIGAPLMIPNSYEIHNDIGNRAFAFADIVSTQLIGKSTMINSAINHKDFNLKRINGTQSYLNYFNKLAEGLPKCGYYASIKGTSDILLNSVKDKIPLHLVLNKSHIHKLAQKLLFSCANFFEYCDIIDVIIKKILYAEMSGIITLSPKALILLNQCENQIREKFSLKL